MFIGFQSDNSYTKRADQSAQLSEKLNTLVEQNEPPHGRICCFDVSEDGWIALGVNIPANALKKRNTVIVYGPEMHFQYAISFSAIGSYSVKYNHKVLNIVLSRSPICIRINDEGTILGIERLEEDEAYAMIARDGLDNNSLKKNDEIYELKKAGFGTGFAQLTRRKEDGEIQVLYESNVADAKPAFFAVALCLVCGISFYIFKEKTKEKERG